MKKQFSILLLSVLFFSCQKSVLNEDSILPQCKYGMEISKKYFANWELFRIDTLAKWKACNRDLDTLKAWSKRLDTIDWRNCPNPPLDFKIEIRSYIIL